MLEIRPGWHPSGARCLGSSSWNKWTAVLRAPGTGFGGLQPTIVFEPSLSLKTAKLRMHFDVNPTDRDQDAELARLLAAGARTADIGQRGDEG